MRTLARQKLVWNLEQDAGPVAGIRFTTASATMLQIQEHLDRLVDNPARTATFNVDDEAQTARVMLESGVIESLLQRAGHLFHLPGVVTQARGTLIKPPTGFVDGPLKRNSISEGHQQLSFVFAATAIARLKRPVKKESCKRKTQVDNDPDHGLIVEYNCRISAMIQLRLPTD